MLLRLILFFVVVSLVWGGAHWYMGRRLITRSRLSAPWRRVAWGLLVLAAIATPANFVLGRALGMRMPMYDGVQLVAFTFMGLSSMLFLFVATADLVRLVARLAERRGLSHPALADPSRRAFMNDVANIGVVGTAAGLAAFGYAGAVAIPRVVEIDVPIEGLPPSLEGYSIVQLTDIHVGPTIRGEWLAGVVEAANRLEPDAIAVTGDLVDGFVHELRDHVAPLGGLRARDGVYFVTGNHEYYWDGPAWCAEVERLGLVVLNNHHRVIERDGARLLVAGVTDISAKGMLPEHASDPAGACRDAPDCAVRVLLAHQPRSAYAAADAGYHLQISGHTHGGQYFPMNLLVHLVQPYVAGLHRRDDMWIYVSRGTGYWGPPMRVGAPSEITRLRLVRA